MTVDLDQYKDAPSDPATLRMRRAALIEQLGWLADEAKALGPLLSELPAWALDQAPLPDDRTAKESLASLPELDRKVYPKWLEKLVAEDLPILPDATSEIDEQCNERDLSDLLEDIQEARAAFTQMVKAVPDSEWTRKALLGDEEVDLFDLVLRIVRNDADCLRNLAYRLHEADLNDQP